MDMYGYMVTYNEGDRYLREAIESLKGQVAGLFVYDDQSTDNTVDILQELKLPHLVRPAGRPSFLEHEGVFRQDAWSRMTSMFSPKSGDWIITLDADEQLRSCCPLRDVAATAQDQGENGTWMQVREMWAKDQMRVDGFWGGIKALRLCAFKPDGLFKTFRQNGDPIRMGGGSLPDYVDRPGKTTLADILHYGYYDPEGRPAKMKRYSAVPGHNPRHIRSIMQPPMLAPLPKMV